MDRLFCLHRETGVHPLQVVAAILPLGGLLLVVGRGCGFLRPELCHGLRGSAAQRVRCLVTVPARTLLVPSLAEELLWRFFLLPLPSYLPGLRYFAIHSVVLLLYVFSHVVCGNVLDMVLKQGGYKKTFSDSRFLLLTFLLGSFCAFLYHWTGCLWPSVVMHWMAVSLWLLVFGGERRLRGK